MLVIWIKIFTSMIYSFAFLGSLTWKNTEHGGKLKNRAAEESEVSLLHVIGSLTPDS